MSYYNAPHINQPPQNPPSASMRQWPPRSGSTGTTSCMGCGATLRLRRSLSSSAVRWSKARRTPRIGFAGLSRCDEHYVTLDAATLLERGGICLGAIVSVIAAAIHSDSACGVVRLDFSAA